MIKTTTFMHSLHVAGTALTLLHVFSSSILQTLPPFYRWANWGAERLSDWKYYPLLSDGGKESTQRALWGSGKHPIMFSTEGAAALVKEETGYRISCEESMQSQGIRANLHHGHLLWDTGSLKQPLCPHPWSGTYNATTGQLIKRIKWYPLSWTKVTQHEKWFSS